MFFSTPHLGTNVARLNSPTKFLFFPSTEVCELEEDSPQLVDLNQNFVQLGTSIYYVITFRGEWSLTRTKGLRSMIASLQLQFWQITTWQFSIEKLSVLAI